LVSSRKQQRAAVASSVRKIMVREVNPWRWCMRAYTVSGQWKMT